MDKFHGILHEFIHLPLSRLPFFGFSFFLFFLAFYILTSGLWVKVGPGEVVVFYRQGSRRIESIFCDPGRHWRRSFREWNMTSELRLQVDEPIIITSRPVEVRTYEGASAILTVRLTLDVTNSARYATAVVGEELEEWQEETLPDLIAGVASGYTVAQVLNDRRQVGDRIADSVAAWFASSGTPNLGLDFKRAAVIDATRTSARRD